MPSSRPTSSASALSLRDYEQATLCIIRLMKETSALANVRLAVVGDLAVKKYLGQSGPCESIEFVINKSASSSHVKKSLLSNPRKLLVEKSGAVFLKHPSGWAVEVKFTPEWMSPYLPSAAQLVDDIDDIDEIPYISLADLFVFKADACGLRESDAGRRREAHLAGALLEIASDHFPLRLEDGQLQKVDEALDTLVEYSLPDHDRAWWHRRLGKQCDKRRSVAEILSELGEGLRLDDEENRRAQRRPSVFSLSNRGSETSINSSASVSSQNTTPLSSPRPVMRQRKMSMSGAYPKHRRLSSQASNMLELLADEDLQCLKQGQTNRDVGRLHVELLDRRGRNSPGIALIARP
ncbi:hypothetical protein F5Y16DRAFT_364389 [Xylariaceae sp. FL0255]|nr:hypothetical protein F5Y16DRAFT_364389 [Xylariaceae sp. FL0255]